MAGCATPPPPSPPPPAPPSKPLPAPTVAPAPAVTATPAPPAVAQGKRVPRRVALGPAAPVRSIDELRTQIAQRLVAAHPEESYTHKTPFNIYAAVSLLIEVREDGSIRRVEVLRRPSQGPETVAQAIEAVRRVAPFGSVKGVRMPWSVTETLLFGHDGLFKPLALER